MNPKYIYLLLLILGIAIPYWELVNFLIETNFDIKLFLDQLLATRASRFFLYDVLVSAIVVFVFIINEKDGIKNYLLPIIFTLLIGVSAGLPLFLYQRELKKEKD